MSVTCVRHIPIEIYFVMWLTIFIYFHWFIHDTTGHVPLYASTPSNKIEQFCVQADTCIHDTIPVCGRMGEETRTFLDICDMLEYVCDTNRVYMHVEDMEGCPQQRKPH